MVLAGAAVLIPCGAWYWLGTRQLERETAQLLESARREAASAAERTASHLTVRLEELDEHESNRPFIQYWPDYIGPGTKPSCGPGTEPRRSPLARGKRHKLVEAYFQIDPRGVVTSPEASMKVADLAFSDPTSVAAVAQSAGRGRGVGSERHLAALQPAVPTGSTTTTAVTTTTTMATTTMAPTRPVTTNDPAPARKSPPPCADQPAQVLPFRWQTGAWQGQAALLAIRQVITGGETFAQGFVVDQLALLHLPHENGLPAILTPGEGRGETEARLPILGAAWHVSVDPTARLHRARARAQQSSRQFHASFFAGGFGAGLAGVFLVILIRRSERLAAERSRFAAAAAHELRTPLAGIRLHGEMLGMSLGNPSRVTEYADRIIDEAERLTRLVANVFNYTQVDQKRLRLALRRDDLGATVRRALALVEPIIDRAGARLVVIIDDDLPPALLDADAVHQMVRNLVDNAEKYSRRAVDRHIEVRVMAEPPGDGEPARVAFSVRDHGPGVPTAEHERIFQPFSRPESDSGAGGLGLGLAVVRTLAVAHGGDVRLISPAEGGATFTVWFPVAPAAVA
jgi:signal transduction histidine kinase